MRGVGRFASGSSEIEPMTSKDVESLIRVFPTPWRVVVNPFGKDEVRDGIKNSDNIFIMSEDGYTILIVGKHPVWNHMEQQRMKVAEFIVEIANKEFERVDHGQEEIRQGPDQPMG